VGTGWVWYFLSGYQCILVISWIWYDELHGYVRSPRIHPISDTYLTWEGVGGYNQEQFRYVGGDVLRRFLDMAQSSRPTITLNSRTPRSGDLGCQLHNMLAAARPTDFLLTQPSARPVREEIQCPRHAQPGCGCDDTHHPQGARHKFVDASCTQRLNELHHPPAINQQRAGDELAVISSLFPLLSYSLFLPCSPCQINLD